MILISFFICQPLVYADEQYATLAEVLQWKYGAGSADTRQANPQDASVHPKMVISVWRSQEPQPTEKQIEQLTNEYYVSQEYWVPRFDVKQFQSDLLLLLPIISNPELRLEFGALNSFALNRDFSGMKQYLQFLVDNGIAIQGDYDAVSEKLKEQGIDLGEW